MNVHLFHHLFGRRIHDMSNADTLALKDVQRKNVIMFVAFAIAVVGAMAVAFVNGEMKRVLLYGAGLSLIIIGYFVLQHVVKKYYWFPYYMLFVGFATMFIYIYLFKGGQIGRASCRESELRSDVR